MIVFPPVLSFIYLIFCVYPYGSMSHVNFCSVDAQQHRECGKPAQPLSFDAVENLCCGKVFVILTISTSFGEKKKKKKKKGKKFVLKGKSHCHFIQCYQAQDCLFVHLLYCKLAKKSFWHSLKHCAHSSSVTRRCPHIIAQSSCHQVSFQCRVED